MLYKKHRREYICRKLHVFLYYFKASCAAAARSVTLKSTGYGFDPHSRRCNIYLNVYFHFFALVSRRSGALCSATQYAMPPKFVRKWETECLNTRFPLPTLLCAGYSVMLKKILLKEVEGNRFFQ